MQIYWYLSIIFSPQLTISSDLLIGYSCASPALDSPVALGFSYCLDHVCTLCQNSLKSNSNYTSVPVNSCLGGLVVMSLTQNLRDQGLVSHWGTEFFGPSEASVAFLFCTMPLFPLAFYEKNLHSSFNYVKLCVFYRQLLWPEVTKCVHIKLVIGYFNGYIGKATAIYFKVIEIGCHVQYLLIFLSFLLCMTSTSEITLIGSITPCNGTAVCPIVFPALELLTQNDIFITSFLVQLRPVGSWKYCAPRFIRECKDIVGK